MKNQDLFHLKDFIVIVDKVYYISTVYMFSDGFETMVFEVDEEDNIDFLGIYRDRYKNSVEAIKGHNLLIAKMKEGVIYEN